MHFLCKCNYIIHIFWFYFLVVLHCKSFLYQNVIWILYGGQVTSNRWGTTKHHVRSVLSNQCICYYVILVAACMKSPHNWLAINRDAIFHRIQSTSSRSYSIAGTSIVSASSIDVHNHEVQTARRQRRTRAIERKKAIGKHEFRRDPVKTPLGRRLISSRTAANDVSRVNAHAVEHSTFFSLHSTWSLAF